MELTERHAETYLAFVEAADLLQLVMEDQLRRDGGLSYLQFSLLARLADAPGGSMRMTDLADSAVHSRSGLSYQARRLEDAGLVTRSRSADDERAVSAAITEAGRSALAAVLPGHLKVVREAFFEALPEPDIARLGGLVATVRDRLRQIAPTAGERRRRTT